MTNLSLKSLIIMILVLAYPVGRIFLPEGSNYDGSSTTNLSYVAYLLEDISIGFGALYYIRFYYRPGGINILAAIWTFFFLFTMIHSTFSESIITSFHLSIRGSAYVFLGLLFCEYVGRGQDSLEKFRSLQVILVVVLLASLIVEIISTISYEYLVVFGAGGSFISLLTILSTLYLFLFCHDDKNIYYYFKMTILLVVILFLTFKLNSFSSVLCFFSALTISLLVCRYYTVSLFIVSVLSIISVWLYEKLFSSDFLIANKSLDVLLSGSGRFEVWKYTVEKIINGELRWYGYGYMADRFFLIDATNLPFNHTCHNSFLTTLVGLGYWGGFFYVFFISFHIYWYFNLRGSRTFKLYVRTSILSIVLFGIGSPMYPGTTTLLIPFSITLFGISSRRNILNIQ